MRGILWTLCDGTTRRTQAHHEPSASRELRKVVNLAVEQVRRPHLAERAQHRLDAPGVTFFPLGEHLADRAALQVVLRPAEIARDYREPLLLGIGGEIGFRD